MVKADQTPPDRKRIFILEDDADYRKLLKGYLGQMYELHFAADLQDACHSFSDTFDLTLVDICLDRDDPDNKDGLQFINFLRREEYSTPVIVLSGYEQRDMPEVIRESFKSGAIDYIRKSRLTPAYLKQLVLDTLVKSSLRNQVRQWKKRLQKLGNWDFIGECRQIRQIKEEIVRVAEDGIASVIVNGETGTGKELVASAIHQKGRRKEGTFVSVNVSALPRELVHRELFGHERGAFTGADRAKPGYIEESDGGILFIDEVGELPNDAQKMLLRVLQERLVYRIGSTTSRKVDFQLVSATNRDLKEEINTNGFRADLYYRLSGYIINLPPLRERGDDILLLANYFLDLFRRQGRTRSPGFSQEVEQIFLSYSWHGNIRELRNVVEGAVIKAGSRNDDFIHGETLPLDFDLREKFHKQQGNGGSETEFTFPIDIKKELALRELQCMEAALKQADGRRTEMWKRISDSTNRYTPPRKIKELLTRYQELRQEVPYLSKCFEKDLAAAGHKPKT